MKVAGNIGGSLLSLGSKEKKNFKKIAASVTRKVEKAGEKAKKSASSFKLVSKGNRNIPLLAFCSRTKTEEYLTPYQRPSSGVVERMVEVVTITRTLE